MAFGPLKRRHDYSREEETVMGKYDLFRKYLQGLPRSMKDHTLNFLEIERILGANLPRSAHDHAAWWSNPSAPLSHPQAQAWLKAGWEVEKLDLRAQWVRFRRQ